MEKDEKASSLIFALFTILLSLLSAVSCAPMLAGEAASQGAALLVVGAAASMSTEGHDENFEGSVKVFNDAFRFEDYAQAIVFVSPDKKEKFWSEADRFKGRIRIAECELRDIQLDEKKNCATAILYFQYWRTESPILETVSFTQKWQYSKKDKTWRVSDSGFDAFPSSSY
jgi:hypothetical protein